MKLFRTLSAIAAALAITTTAGLAKDGINTKCPIKGKDGADKPVTVEIEVCCEKCAAKITDAPGSYLAKAAKAEDGKCAVSGKKASETVEVVVNVCCGGCKKKMAKNPKKYLADVEVASKSEEKKEEKKGS